MTPKEKAKELVYKFYDEIKYMERAKLCALIAVDYLIDEQTMWQNGEPNPVLYWEEVKQELEKL